MIQSMYSNEKYSNAYDAGIGNFLADTSVDSPLAQVRNCLFAPFSYMETRSSAETGLRYNPKEN